MVKFSVVKQRKLGREGPALCSPFFHRSLYHLRPPFLTQNSQQVSHSFRCCNKNSVAWWLVQQTLISPSSGGREGQGQGASRLRVRGARSLAHGWPSWPRELWVFYQGTDPAPEGPTPVTNHPQRPHLQIQSHWRLGFKI